jgi:hypothetical protein
MKPVRRPVLILVALLIAVPALCDDAQKTEKQLHKITAMATDATGRRVVSMTVADNFGIKRADMVTERRTSNINYGDMIIAQTLVKNGVKMDDIAAQLKAGKTMEQIANEHHLDWKALAVEAKKLNTKVEDNLYRHFLNGKPDADRDQAEGYDPNIDGVAADNNVSKEDIEEAQNTYVLWKDRAAKNKDSKLDTSAESAARGNRGDPVHSVLSNGADSSAAPPK